MMSRTADFTQQWIRQRLPQTREVTLNQRRIFIVPSKLALGMLLLIILLFVLAINFQNSLVYAVCFWLMALLVLNILHTYRNLAGITLKVIGLSPCFAGANATLEIELSCPPKQKKYAVHVGWPEHDMIEVNLAQQHSVRTQLAHPTTRRGRFTPPRITIETRYPLRLAVAWSYLMTDASAIIYPTPKARTENSTTNTSSTEHSGGTEIPRGSHDFGGIREYQPDDAPRQLHWGKYAQTGELYSKTFVDYSSPQRWLAWETLPFPGTEARLSHLCSQVLDCHAKQQEYGLSIPGTRIEPAQGEAHKQRCLSALALFGEQA